MNSNNERKRSQDNARASRYAAEMLRRERLSRTALLSYQNKQLLRLLNYAINNSAFYRKLYSKVKIDQSLHLETLPVVTKEMVMNHFDELVTDRRIKLHALQKYIEKLEDDDYYLGEYRVLTTAGSSGFKGIFVYDRNAWSHILAAVLQAASFMNLERERSLRIASIGASSPLHMSYRRAISRTALHHQYLRLEATDEIKSIIDQLNEFQPEYIHLYPSMANMLAEQQQQGNLNIKPEIILTGAESLRKGTIQRINDAWGILPFNSYSATEGVLGIECDRHRGIHIFDDLGIVESVDEKNQPVPEGTRGHKILFTNLYQFTQPLIRYEISDMVILSGQACPCGRAFSRISAIQGRNEDIMYFDGINGERVPVLPVLFEDVMDRFEEIVEFQVRQKAESIYLRYVVKYGTDKSLLEARIHHQLQEKFKSMSALFPPLCIEYVNSINRESRLMGKVRLIRKTDDDAVDV
jgi:phenylacetate-CoA ligase